MGSDQVIPEPKVSKQQCLMPILVNTFELKVGHISSEPVWQFLKACKKTTDILILKYIRCSAYKSSIPL